MIYHVLKIDYGTDSINEFVNKLVNNENHPFELVTLTNDRKFGPLSKNEIPNDLAANIFIAEKNIYFRRPDGRTMSRDELYAILEKATEDYKKKLELKDFIDSLGIPQLKHHVI